MKHRIITMAFAVCFVSALALASDTWTLDTDTSYVRLFQGSRANPSLVNTGVASVTGRVELDPNNLDHSILDLSIYPADEDWQRALSPEGTLLTGYVPDATDETLLTFKSKHILRTENDQLQVIGDLTLSRVERTVTAIPSEAYAGPVYGTRSRIPVPECEGRIFITAFDASGSAKRSSRARRVNRHRPRGLSRPGGRDQRH